VIAALAAVALLSEQISVRLITSAALIIGGIALAVVPRSR
jgi:drug/metabolite transporter (DMT)-like permease